MSQNQKIIDTLVKHAGAWVTAGSLEIMTQQNGIRYNIYLLRKRGYDIEHRRNPVSGNSEYRVIGKAVSV
jgi:tRNA pseudouridine-54 N-methylase